MDREIITVTQSDLSFTAEIQRIEASSRDLPLELSAIENLHGSQDFYCLVAWMPSKKGEGTVCGWCCFSVGPEGCTIVRIAAIKGPKMALIVDALLDVVSTCPVTGMVSNTSIIWPEYELGWPIFNHLVENGWKVVKTILGNEASLYGEIWDEYVLTK